MYDCRLKFSARVLSARAPNATREARMLPGLFEQLPQILKHGVFFVRARAIGEKELLAQVQCLSLHCSGIKSVPYRTQELISVHLTSLAFRALSIDLASN
jgi:hypothetical protein